jgi:hypothetical protein
MASFMETLPGLFKLRAKLHLNIIEKVDEDEEE